MITSGSVVDRYEVGPEIGRGGMGRVYRARDRRLDREVALKVVDVQGDAVSKEARRRLLREARAAAALDHPGAVGIFDVSEAEGLPYIVMELVPGESMRQAMTRPEHDRRTRLGWLLEVARVLRAAHEAELIHRDIKPENVMIRPDGSLRVLDFGIARRPRRPVAEGATTEDSVFATITEAGIPIGTPIYMSPEQIRGEDVDGRTDQFAWGVMAYELLTGKPPWRLDDSLQLVAAILTEDPPPVSEVVPEVSPAVSAIVERTLEKDPARRFARSADLVAALEAVLGDARAGEGEKPAPQRALAPSGDLSGYTAAEVSEILERALLRQPVDEPGADAGDLLEIARSMGVADHVLDEAAEELSEVKSPYEQKKAQGHDFRRHVAIWGAGAVFFFLLNMITSPSTWWFLYPVLSWGFAVAMHGIGYHFSDPPKRRERKLRRLAQRLSGERHRTGLALEPAVRSVSAALERLAAGEDIRVVAPMDSQLSWDARFAARRIDSREAGADRGPRIADSVAAHSEAADSGADPGAADSRADSVAAAEAAAAEAAAAEAAAEEAAAEEAAAEEAAAESAVERRRRRP